MVKPVRLFHLLSLISLTLVSRAQIALQIETATKVQFNASAGKTYQVYATTNLNRTGWTALGAPQAGSDGAITFFHTTTGDQKVFFKVEESDGVPISATSGTPLVLLQKARLNLNGQNLSGLTLSNLDLNNFSFANAIITNSDLSGSKFTQSTIVGVNFSNTKLVGADLSEANGFSLNFTNADLSNALLGGQEGTFQNANLSGATILSKYEFAGDFTGVNARGLIATNASLALRGTAAGDFTGADFSGASLAFNTSFVGANLTAVKFVNTTFEAPIPFDNANLTDADLTGAKGFHDAPGIIYKNTKMPDGTVRNSP